MISSFLKNIKTYLLDHTPKVSENCAPKNVNAHFLSDENMPMEQDSGQVDTTATAKNTVSNIGINIIEINTEKVFIDPNLNSENGISAYKDNAMDDNVEMDGEQTRNDDKTDIGFGDVNSNMQEYNNGNCSGRVQFENYEQSFLDNTNDENDNLEEENSRYDEFIQHDTSQNDIVDGDKNGEIQLNNESGMAKQMAQLNCADKNG